jgi:Tfp pilus assembly protein PilO
MRNNLLSILPTQSIVLFLLCSVGIAVFILLVILPSRQTAAELEVANEELQAKIEQQRILTPVFTSLLEKVKSENPTELPLVEPTRLPRGELERLLNQLKELAQRNNLTLKEIAPEADSLKEESEYLQIRLILTGDFFNFRPFILDLGSIPSFVHSEEIRIRAVEDSQEIQLKIWLAQA